MRGAGSPVVSMRTATGQHAETGNPFNGKGWEEWELDDTMKVTSATGWFDGETYDRQVAG